MSADPSRRAALSVWKFEPTYQALQDTERALAQAQEVVSAARTAWARVVGSRPEMFPPEARAAASGGQAADLKTMPGQADAHLRALLRYTEGFYATAIEHGMKAGPTANAIAHVERAGKALHEIVHAQAKMLASLPAPAVPSHNFGKPLGWAVVADTPEHPKQHGMRGLASAQPATVPAAPPAMRAMPTPRRPASRTLPPANPSNERTTCDRFTS